MEQDLGYTFIFHINNIYFTLYQEIQCRTCIQRKNADKSNQWVEADKETFKLRFMKGKDKYFDHTIGEQNHKSTPKDIKMLKRVIKVHSEDYSEEEKMNFQRIGIHLSMKRYFTEPIIQIKPVGEFLNELLEIYNVKKTKFAELIDYENTNLHAVLKGRRRLNNKLATKIGSIFLIEPQLWMYIDAKNELAKFQRENKFHKSKYTLEKLKYAR